MALSISVLCPSGRRRNLKVSSNTKILHVLEESCAKDGLLPEWHDIKKELGREGLINPSMSVQLAGVTNNTHLELVKRDIVRKDELISVMIQLDEGNRLSGAFAPNTSLWSVLCGIISDREGVTDPPAGKQPTVVYMREEVVGKKALETMDLRMFGLTSGKVLFRFTSKEVDDAALEKHNQQLTELKTKMDKIYDVVSGIRAGDIAAPLTEKSEAPPSAAASGSAASQAATTSRQASSTATAAAAPDADTAQFMNNMSKFISAVQWDGPAPDQRQLPAEALLPEAQQQQPNFSNFHFPAETAGQDLRTEAAREAESRTDQELNTFLSEPCPRRTAVYVLSQGRGDGSSADVEDESFFTLTVEDLKSILKSTREIYQEDEPLQTKTMRETDKLMKLARYPVVTLHIKFPDKHILHGEFRPLEKVSSVYGFVRDCLGEPNLKFHLYTAPPKKVLKENCTIFDEDLSPQAVVYISAKDETGSKDPVLKQLLLESATPMTQATMSEARRKNSGGGCGPIPEERFSGGALAGCSGAQSQTSSQPKLKKPGGAPKWFKMGN